MNDSYFILFLLIPIVAFLYASVGRGGASGYLALMSILGFTQEVMKPTALLLNLFVAGIAFYHFWRAGYFRQNLFLAFSISSIPFSFLGGRLTIEPHLYKLILGICLLIATLKIFGIFNRDKEEVQIKKFNLKFALLLGAGIGFLSGLIGIGGGIILSPLILLLNWGTVKEAAAVSALFIWVNSASGLFGQFSMGLTVESESWLMIALAVVGGYLGAYIGSNKLNNYAIRQLLATVLLFASIKLIIF